MCPYLHRQHMTMLRRLDQFQRGVSYFLSGMLLCTPACLTYSFLELRVAAFPSEASPALHQALELMLIGATPPLWSGSFVPIMSWMIASMMDMLPPWLQVVVL